MPINMLLILVLTTFSLFACTGTKAVVDNAGTDAMHRVSTDTLPYMEEIVYKSVGHPVMTFDNSLHQFGKMKKGEKASHTYKFTNTGDTPLEIEIISACDCTTLEWAEGKIVQPGESGEIKATFDSGHNGEDTGFVSKDITIVANTEPIVVVLYYTATVEE